MKRALISLGIPALFALAGVLALAQWMRQVAALPTEQPRVPIAHRPLIASLPAAPAPALAPVVPEPSATPAAPAPASPFETVPGHWPCFRGPDFDNVSKETAKLNRDWEMNPPKELWSVNDLGEGYAAPAVAEGRVFLVDYDQTGRNDNVRCFRLADGRPLWNHAYPADVKRNHGMSRTVPAVSSNCVVTLGPLCHVNAFEPATGRRLWGIDLVREYGATVPEWYAGQCPVIEDGRVILAPGGSNALLVAVNSADGKVAWTTPNPRGWAMSHASIVPHTFKGRRMYIYVSRGGIAAVDARDGALLWEFEDWRRIIADIPSVIAMGEDKLFVARAYEQGSLILQLREEGGAFRAELVRKLPRRVFGSDQHTPVFFGGHVYGVRPPRGELVCLDPDGNPKWTSGAGVKFGLGGFTIADGLIFIMDDDGTLAVVEAVPDAYRPVARRKVLTGRETWCPVTVTGGRLLVRDSSGDRPNSSRLVCLDVSAK